MSENNSEKLRLGGMALANGVLIHGPTHWAAAAWTDSEELKVASGRKPRFKMFDRVPILRGIARIGESLIVIPLMKRSLPKAKLSHESGNTLALMVLVGACSYTLQRKLKPSLARELATNSLSLLPAIASLKSGELASYHGAEHKVIAAYEQSIDPKDSTKEHDRCGSHLVGPLILSQAVSSILLRKLHPKANKITQSTSNLVALGVAVEIFNWADKNPGSKASAIMKAPGFRLQESVGTAPPTDQQLMVAQAALEEILRTEQSSS